MSEKVVLSINKLSFGYTKEKKVLKDINLVLNEGAVSYTHLRAHET